MNADGLTKKVLRSFDEEQELVSWGHQMEAIRYITAELKLRKAALKVKLMRGRQRRRDSEMEAEA